MNFNSLQRRNGYNYKTININKCIKYQSFECKNEKHLSTRKKKNYFTHKNSKNKKKKKLFDYYKIRQRKREIYATYAYTERQFSFS